MDDDPLRVVTFGYRATTYFPGSSGARLLGRSFLGRASGESGSRLGTDSVQTVLKTERPSSPEDLSVRPMELRTLATGP